MADNHDWRPTARLRWVRRAPQYDDPRGAMILQQWHAPDVPGYMRGSEGEWRDVPVESEDGAP